MRSSYTRASEVNPYVPVLTEMEPDSAGAVGPHRVIESVPEVADAGKNHCNPPPVGGFDGLRVPDRATRLRDRRDPSCRRDLDSVREGEVGIARQHRASRPA